MVNLIDIAREVGLDVSVVSRTLNPGSVPHPVKKETRELILSAAKRLGYRPNRQAAFLKKGSAATLMCFMPDLGYRLIADLVYGISEAAAEANYPVNFFFGKNTSDFCRFYQTLREVPHAAAICYAPSHTENCSRAKKNAVGLPQIEARCRRKILDYYAHRKTLLLLNLESNLDLTGEDEICRIPRIEIDDACGGRQVALHFLERGCTRFFYGTGYVRYSLRLGGYVSALREKGCEAVELDRDVLRELPHLSERCGIFMDTDLRAFHLMGLLKERHIPLGKDILLSGYDDIFPSAEMIPSLTTIHMPTREEGRMAVHFIQKTLNKEKIGVQMLEPSLIIRETTGGTMHTTDELPWERKNP